MLTPQHGCELLIQIQTERHNKTNTQTSVAVTFEVVNGADISIEAGFGLANSASARALT